MRRESDSRDNYQQVPPQKFSSLPMSTGEIGGASGKSISSPIDLLLKRIDCFNVVRKASKIAVGCGNNGVMFDR